MPILAEPPPDPVDLALIPVMDKWAATITSRTSTAGKAKQAYLTWRKAVTGR
jgi:hypothetical protein